MRTEKIKRIESGETVYMLSRHIKKTSRVLEAKGIIFVGKNCGNTLHIMKGPKYITKSVNGSEVRIRRTPLSCASAIVKSMGKRGEYIEDRILVTW